VRRGDVLADAKGRADARVEVVLGDDAGKGAVEPRGDLVRIGVVEDRRAEATVVELASSVRGWLRREHRWRRTSLARSKHTKGAKQDQAAMRIELLVVNLRRRAMAATTFGRLERGGGSRAALVVSAASHPEPPPAANGGDEEGSCDEEHGR